MKRPSSHRGAALIVTLAMIAMMTFLVVAFLSRSVVNLQVETSSDGASRADVLARSACQTIVSDFHSEIVAGSTVSGTASQMPIYVPTNPSTSVPAVSRFAFTGTDVPVFVNLVKQSNGPFFPNAPPYSASGIKPIIQDATDTYTDVASPNGRSVINKRWDNPTTTATNIAPAGPLLLISPSGAAAPTASRFSDSNSTNKMLPRWIVMTRQGVPASQAFVSGWKDYSTNNTGAAIGRFAYNIYNVGGLLDVNVAGFQENSAAPALTVNALGQKGTLGLAKLGVIPGMGTTPDTSAAQFASTWRNAASGGTVDNYLAYLGLPKNGTTDLTVNPFFMMGPRSGFLTPAASTAASDNRVLGRQDLIRLAIKTPTGSTQPYGLSMASLPYLTHFSREVNAPSWYPTLTAPNAAYPYAGNKNSSTAENRFLPNVRVAAGASWRRWTGEYAVPGEPLIKYRFPLSWLTLLTDADPTTPTWDLTPEAIAIVKALDLRITANGGTPLAGGTFQEKAATLVQRAFGLVWNQPEYRWDYTGSPTPSATPTAVETRLEVLGDASSTSKAVCLESREPNFFELLKAGILSGSLGNASDYESLSSSIGEDSNPDYHVIQIGANIIDQADADSYPTRIAFGYEMDTPERSILTPPTGNTVRTPTGSVGNNALKPARTPAGLNENKVFAGVEDIPYLNTFVLTPYRLPKNDKNLYSRTDVAPNVQNDQRDSIDGWLQFVLWKPQQASNATVEPPSFRIYYTGSDIHFLYWGPDSTAVGYNPLINPEVTFPAPNGPVYKARPSEPILPTQTYVTFSDTSSDFRTPTLLGGVRDPNSATLPAHNFFASQLEGNGKNPNGSTPLPCGMWLGETLRPEKIAAAGSPNNAAPPTQFLEFHCWEDSRFELQYRDGGGSWRTYQRYDRFGLGTGHYYLGRGLFGYTDSPTAQASQGSPVYNSATPPAYCSLDISVLALSAIDPRSQRFGLLAQFLDYLPPSYFTPGMVPPSGSGFPWKYFLKQGWAPKQSGAYNMLFGPASSNSRFFPDWTTGGTRQNPWQGHTASDTPITDPNHFWADNPVATTTPATNYYKDMDGVQRRADGDVANGVRTLQLTSATTLYSQNLGRVLNRPLRSVGELGYVFRDEPFKSLNLFTDTSADSALLDLFCVNDQPALVAGKVNLNTQVPEVLQAMIVSAAREELSTTNLITPAEALSYAKNLVATTSVPYGTNIGPIINPAEIANRLSAIVPVSGTNPNTTIKAQREVVGRALAGSGQTRTWNFLVDIIAQSGRYGPDANKASQFIVEGERHYWLHVAIDRYTGRVVDQQLEHVLE